MTNHRVGKTNTRDPRGGWRGGKVYKAETKRAIRRLTKTLLRKDPDSA